MVLQYTLVIKTEPRIMQNSNVFTFLPIHDFNESK